MWCTGSLEIDIYILIRPQDISEYIVLIDLYFNLGQNGARPTWANYSSTDNLEVFKLSIGVWSRKVILSQVLHCIVRSILEYPRCTK